jgi:3-hydroxyisobutyrate dehydrogenase
MKTIGFIGLGNMGQPMARNIQKSGYSMVVYDLRKETQKDLIGNGAHSASSISDVAKKSDIIFTSLPGPKEVENVAIGPQGLLNGISPGNIYVDLSTDRPSLVRKIASMFSEKGAHMLDAPVSGGVPGAITGNLAIMVGGEKKIYDQIKPVLDSFGDKVVYCGGVGSGNICKVAHNLIGVLVAQALAEALTMGVKAGVEPAVLWDAIRKGAVGRMSMLHQRIPETVFVNKFEPPKFALELATKDVRLATEVGRENKVPMPITNLVEQAMVHALNRGWGGKDLCSLFLLQEEAAGVQVRIPEVNLENAAKLVIFNPDVIDIIKSSTS